MNALQQPGGARSARQSPPVTLEKAELERESAAAASPACGAGSGSAAASPSSMGASPSSSSPSSASPSSSIGAAADPFGSAACWPSPAAGAGGDSREISGRYACTDAGAHLGGYMTLPHQAHACFMLQLSMQSVLIRLLGRCSLGILDQPHA